MSSPNEGPPVPGDGWARASLDSEPPRVDTPGLQTPAATTANPTPRASLDQTRPPVGPSPSQPRAAGLQTDEGFNAALRVWQGEYWTENGQTGKTEP